MIVKATAGGLGARGLSYWPLYRLIAVDALSQFYHPTLSLIRASLLSALSGSVRPMGLDEKTDRIVGHLKSFAELQALERNAISSDRMTPDLENALSARAQALGRQEVAKHLELDERDLTGAERRIIDATGAYVGLKRRGGTNANRTLRQLSNRGLIGAAEAAIIGANPSSGFAELSQAGLGDLSYESIAMRFSEEFSDRALWYARRTLGHPNKTEKPPPQGDTPIQVRTDRLIDWLAQRADGKSGRIESWANSDAASAIGLGDLRRFGMVAGNIQSRLDYACFECGLPPLGLSGDAPFERAWGNSDRWTHAWKFHISEMQVAARQHAWSPRNFEDVRAFARKLPGQGHIAWKKALAEREHEVREWAEALGQGAPGLLTSPAPAPKTLGPLGSAFREICELQAEYDKTATPAMLRRGELIQATIADGFAPEHNRFTAALCVSFPGRVEEKGSNGEGNIARIPWYRFYDPTMSENAQTGWYVAILVRGDGAGFYVALCHGSTQLNNGSYRPYPTEEMAAQVEFARGLSVEDGFNLHDDGAMDLRGARLASAYEKSTALWTFIEAGSIPPDDRLTDTVVGYLAQLGRIYRAVSDGRQPGAVPEEEQALEELLRPNRKGGQGIGLTGPERKEVELRAMKVATEHFERLGYKVTDMSAKASFDLKVTEGDVDLCVEVKGTTGTGNSVLMTSNEVELHKRKFPNNALIIVSHIELERGEKPVASGGEMREFRPWDISSAADVRPAAYRITP